MRGGEEVYQRRGGEAKGGAGLQRQVAQVRATRRPRDLGRVDEGGIRELSIALSFQPGDDLVN